jgi:hypothetical protein
VVGGGGYALLCGARPAWFLRKLDNLEDDPDLRHLASSIVLEHPVVQDRGPALRLVTLDEEDEAAEVCEGLGVQYSPFAADRLLNLLPKLTSLIQSGLRVDGDLPGGVFPTRMGTGTVGQPLFEEPEDPLERKPGTYCMTLFDTRRYFFVLDDARVYESGRGEAIYMELCRRGENVLLWDPAGDALLVPARFRLPQLYERAAVLRTGLLPMICAHRQSHATFLRYRNIDRSFADTLSTKLFQKLEVAESWEFNP